jgi:hypothetical protein
MQDCLKKVKPIGRRIASLMKEFEIANPAPQPPTKTIGVTP